MHPYEALKKVPRGFVTTYRDLGVACRMHQRAVAALMRCNKDPENIPCYKVVMSDGRLGGYGLGIKKKIELLRKDGIIVKNGGIDLNKYAYKF